MMRKLDESVLRVERIHEFGDGFTGGVKFREGYGSHRVYRYDASWLQTASSAVSVFSDHSESMFRSKRMSSFHSQVQDSYLEQNRRNLPLGYRSENVLALDENVPESVTPMFDGTNPDSWIEEVERFFRLFCDEERMGLVFLCLKGPAYRWFAWETERRRITDWIGFKCRVLARFGHVRSCSSVEMRVEEDSSFRSGAIHGIFVEKIASPFVVEVVLMHLSMFDGANPESWIVQADRFFVHYEDDAKLDLIFLYLKGDAYKWFYWMMRRQRFKDWSDFKKQLLARFGPAMCCSTVDVNVKDESTVLSEGVHETEVEKHSTTVEEASLTSVAKVHQKDLVCEIVPETDMVKQTVTVEVNLTEESPFRNVDVSADLETEETNNAKERFIS